MGWRKRSTPVGYEYEYAPQYGSESLDDEPYTETDEALLKSLVVRRAGTDGGWPHLTDAVISDLNSDYRAAKAECERLADEISISKEKSSVWEHNYKAEHELIEQRDREIAELRVQYTRLDAAKSRLVADVSRLANDRRYLTAKIDEYVSALNRIERAMFPIKVNIKAYRENGF